MKHLAVKLLLAMDGVFIATHIVLHLADVRVSSLDVELDGSYPEQFQYLKWLCLFLTSSLAGYLRHERSFFLLSFVFLLLLGDDAFSFHEVYGALIAASLEFQPAYGLRSEDYGEILCMSLLALTVLGLWLVSFCLAQKETKRHLFSTAKFLVAFGFFAFGLDMAHQALSSFGETIYFTLGVVEDGGEMAVVSLLLAHFLPLISPKAEPIAQGQGRPGR